MAPVRDFMSKMPKLELRRTATAAAGGDEAGSGQEEEARLRALQMSDFVEAKGCVLPTGETAAEYQRKEHAQAQQAQVSSTISVR